MSFNPTIKWSGDSSGSDGGGGSGRRRFNLGSFENRKK
jgi:hypothetical protein